MPGKMIDIKATDGGSFQGFLATPDSGSGAGNNSYITGHPATSPKAHAALPTVS